VNLPSRGAGLGGSRRVALQSTARRSPCGDPMTWSQSGHVRWRPRIPPAIFALCRFADRDISATPILPLGEAVPSFNSALRENVNLAVHLDLLAI
jgi:hypothetical protein